MNTKTFKTIDNINLVVKNNKTFVILEMEEQSDKIRFDFRFKDEVFIELINYIKKLANSLWNDFLPKEATGYRTDYYEYYDRKLDSNGYLSILSNGLLIERPCCDSLKLYQFNKGRLESFIYDMNNLNS